MGSVGAASKAVGILTFLIGVLGGLLVILLADSRSPGELVGGPIRFMVCALVAASALTTMHEAGHAIVGRLVGFEVFGVTIGQGPRLVGFDVGSTRVEFRRTMIGGATFANATGVRWRDAAMYSAGVAVEAVVLVVVLAWSPDPGWGQAAKWAIVSIAALDMVANLWPRRVDVGPVAGLSSDGAQLVAMVTRTDQWRQDVLNNQLSPELARIVQTLYGGEPERALELALAHGEANPDDPVAQKNVGTLLLLSDRWREAADWLAPLVTEPDDDPLLANNAAWSAVMTFDPDLLPQADQFSEWAFSARPTEPACANTRGATLVMLGRPDEGLRLLELAASGRLSVQQKAFVIAFTSLAKHRLGRHREASEHLQESRRLDADCPALPHIERLILTPPAGNPAPWPPPTQASRSH